jgi:CheY-like chemotaxis protein
MKYTILVVDDDPQIRKLCRVALEESGCSVSEAGNGKEALHAIQGATVDLILLDISMPDVDGFEFMKAVRARRPELKIVVMSGFIGGRMLPAAKLMGGSATIAKPFSTPSLISIVSQTLGPVPASQAS